jgi:hypothetical protein
VLLNAAKQSQVSLSTLLSLMAGFSQQFAMLVLSHFFSPFFNDAAQPITSFPPNWKNGI